MKVNFNNEKFVEVKEDNVNAFLDGVKQRITGNAEHLWLEYKNGKVSVEKKWHRFENSDDEIIADVEKFITKGVMDTSAVPVTTNEELHREPKKTTSTKPKAKKNGKKKK